MSKKVNIGKNGLESRISSVLKTGESVVIIGADGQQKTLTAAGSTSIKPMASTRSLNDIAGIKGELTTGKHSVHRKARGNDEVELSGMPKKGGARGSVVFSTAEYLRHTAKEATIGIRSGALLVGNDGRIMLAEHIK